MPEEVVAVPRRPRRCASEKTREEVYVSGGQRGMSALLGETSRFKFGSKFEKTFNT